MNENRVLRTGVDTGKAAKAAIAQVRTGEIIQGGVGGTTVLGLEHKQGRMRRFVSRVFRRLLPLMRPLLYRYREYMNLPIANRLAQFETYSQSHGTGSINQLLERLDRIEAYALAAARRTAVNCGNGRILVQSSVGYVMCSAEDTALLACLIDTGELERGTRLLIERLVRPGTTFVDAGANVGLHTLAAARAMRGVGKAVAFEPYGPTRSLLSESVFINGFSGIVEIHEAAVSSQPGVRQLHLGATSGHHSLYPLEEGGNADRKVVDVRLARLADVIPQHERIDLIKIDVEGAEIEVLESARAFIEANPDIALIVEFGPSHLARTGCAVADWFDAFARLGLVYQAIDPLNGDLVACTPEQLRQAESTNLLFARRDSPVWERACATS